MGDGEEVRLGVWMGSGFYFKVDQLESRPVGGRGIKNQSGRIQLELRLRSTSIYMLRVFGHLTYLYITFEIWEY